MKLSRRAGWLLAAWVAVVVAVSVSAGGRPSWVRALAASPARVREGKVWFVLTSAALVDHPVVLSLLSFCALAVLALNVCGSRVFWWSAFLGQVAATLLVYAFIGMARWVVPGVFDLSVVSPDYGVSTISAAWLGAVAAVMWRRRASSRAGKAAIAASCVSVGMFAYTVRPEVTVLSSEHLVAFALGVVAASPSLVRILWRRPLDALRSLRQSLTGKHGNRARTAVAAFAVTLTITAAPAGVAALRHRIDALLPPTVTRCTINWNRPRGALLRVPIGDVSRVSIGVARLVAARHRVRAEYCRFIFAGRARVARVVGLWRHGRVIRWTVAVAWAGARVVKPNAALLRTGRLRLLGSKHRLVLSS